MSYSINNERLRRLIYLGIAILTFIVLAAGISSVQPKAGEIVFAPRGEREFESEGLTETTIESHDVDPGSPIGFVALAATIAAALYGAYHSRRVRYGIFFLFIFASFLFGAIMAYQYLYVPPENETEDFGDYFRPLQERPPDDLFDNPPDWLDSVSVAATLVVLIIIGVVIYAAMRIQRYRKPPLELVARDAEATLAEIRAGVEVKDAVMRCYLDMSNTLIRQRGLARDEGMTPREFEEVLVEEGLPPESVDRLTRLFERVRYGAREASEEDKLEATAALEEIVFAIRQSGQKSSREATAVNAYA